MTVMVLGGGEAGSAHEVIVDVVRKGRNLCDGTVGMKPYLWLFNVGKSDNGMREVGGYRVRAVHRDNLGVRRRNRRVV